METKALSILLAGSLLVPAFALENPVRIDSGLIAGEIGPMSFFKGIPYATPPIGNLRWRPPAPVKPWPGVRAAAEFGADCMRRESQPERPLSEDCLFLNITTPARAPADKLPVMVWIHGGGFHGIGSERYSSEPLARKGVVVVTFNYRLSVLGFLAHPALTAESPQHSSGNYGLLDQIAALKWVQANIAAFGGDPARVTIFGPSAGATSVCRLILSPLAKGLFHRAIAQSPAAEFRPLRTLAEAEKLGESWGAEIKAMRAMAAAELTARVQGALGPTFPGTPTSFWPIVDGWVIPAEDIGLYRTGKINAVPLMIGNTVDEVGGFVPPAITLAGFRAYVQKSFGPLGARVLDRYPAERDAEAFEAAARLLGDTEFNYGAVATARAMSRWQKVFRYHFTRVRGSRKASRHGDENPYVWGSLELPRPGIPSGAVEPADQKLSEAMMAAWVRFAGTGDPNGGNLPDWPAHTEGNEQHMEFGAVIRVGSGLHAETIRFWDEIFRR